MTEFDLFKLWLFKQLASFQASRASTGYEKGYLSALEAAKEEIERLQQ